MRPVAFSRGHSRRDYIKRHQNQKTRDEVAVLGDCSERVSAALKFPDPRENTGNSR